MGGRVALVTAVVVAAALALPGAASAMFTGVERVIAYSEPTSENKGVTVTCPSGKRVMSAGGDVADAFGLVALTALRPSSSLTSVRVEAAETEGGTTGTWRVAAIAVCAPPPAGLERIAALSASSSAAKRVAATCPAGKRALGTGGEVAGALPRVVIDGIVPSSDLKTVEVNAFETPTGTSAAWTATAYAICASPAQSLVRVSTTSDADSTFIKAAGTDCPGGRTPVGLGGEVDTGGGRTVFATVSPGSDALRPNFMAFEDRVGHAGDWSVTAHVICGAATVRAAPSRTSAGDGLESVPASCAGGRQVTAAGAGTEFGRGEVWLAGSAVQAAPGTAAELFWATETARSARLTAYLLCTTPLAGSTTIAASSDPGGAGDPAKSVTVRCPSGLRALSGTGFASDLGNRAAVQSLLPLADLTGVGVRIAETETGFPSDWLLGADALCVPPPPGLVRLAQTAPADSVESKSAVATCPAGKHLLGLGAAVSPGTGQILLDDVRPDPALRSVTVEAFEDRNGYEEDWSVTAYAVCVNR